MKNLQQQMIKLHNDILYHDYYVDLYLACCEAKGLHAIGYVSCMDDLEIMNLCNDFWEALPDCAACRRGPFWLLCQIANPVFDEE